MQGAKENQTIAAVSHSVFIIYQEVRFKWFCRSTH